MQSLHQEFDHIAKRLWFGDIEAARLVAAMTDKDRHALEQCLLSLYGVSVHLTGSETDIITAVKKARRT